MNLHTVGEMGNRVQADDGLKRFRYYAVEEKGGAPYFRILIAPDLVKFSYAARCQKGTHVTRMAPVFPSNRSGMLCHPRQFNTGER